MRDEELPRFERIHHPTRSESPRRQNRARNLAHSPNACRRKTGYASKRLAWDAINKRGRRPDSRVYHCDACGRWHCTLWTPEQNLVRERDRVGRDAVQPKDRPNKGE